MGIFDSIVSYIVPDLIEDPIGTVSNAIVNVGQGAFGIGQDAISGFTQGHGGQGDILESVGAYVGTMLPGGTITTQAGAWIGDQAGNIIGNVAGSAANAVGNYVNSIINGTTTEQPPDLPPIGTGAIVGVPGSTIPGSGVPGTIVPGIGIPGAFTGACGQMDCYQRCQQEDIARTAACRQLTTEHLLRLASIGCTEASCIVPAVGKVCEKPYRKTQHYKSPRPCSCA